jgi:CrcB protein
MVSNWLPFVYVGVGGFAGAMLRYSVSLGLQQYSIVLPYGTLLANFIGCFVIGVIAQIAENTEILSPETRLFLATGFCGGLTTLSSMIFEFAQLLREGELFYGSVYFLATFSGAFLSFYMGILVIRMIFKY